MSKRQGKEKTILNYFKRIRKESSDEKESEENSHVAVVHADESAQVQNCDTDKIHNSVLEPLEPLAGPSSSTMLVMPSGSSSNLTSIDIGTLIAELKNIDDFTRYHILTNHWAPDKNYVFPYSSHMKRGREEKRRPNVGHFEKHSWLVFSKFKQGVFCKYCALFFSQTLTGGQKTVLPRKLVTEPLIHFAKLSGIEGDLHKHEITNYHNLAIEKGKFYILCYVLCWRYYSKKSGNPYRLRLMS